MRASDGRLAGFLTPTWRYALVGGIVSMPLSLGLYWYSGMGTDFSLNMVFVGGLLAGYLAKRGSVDAKSAGLRAGVIGALPGLVWIFPGILTTARTLTDSFPPTMAVSVVVFSGMVLGIGALAGLIGGAIGGWLVEKLGGTRTPGVET
ncbi:DUF5518 domain-containing protein [Salinigranum sp. GCM10025319]|uniref:DUF5518 domain-containing protein n=1 Tax=Salinigranum sp. GCM10025319 TaxID=3252687 RepID=UPI003606E346